MTHKSTQIQKKYGKPLSQVLIEEFEKYGNQKDVAKSLGVSQPTISQWLKWLNLIQHTIVKPADQRQEAL